MISLTEFAKWWQQFFHAPEPVATLCVFRVLFGLLMVGNACTLIRHARDFFGPEGLLSAQEFTKAYPRRRFTLFHLLPATNATTRAVVIGLIVFASALALGFCTVVAGPLTWICLVSLHHRNQMVFNAGDTLQRLLLLLLCFAPSGAGLSVDCWIKGENPLTALRDHSFDPWPLRLMQIQISMVYLRSVFWKLRGKIWRNGTAVAYVLQVMPFRRFSAPRIVLLPLVTQVLTYGTLVAEAYIPVALWIRELRYSAILLGWLLHLSFEMFLNVHLFGLTMCIALVVFISPAAIARFLP